MRESLRSFSRLTNKEFTAVMRTLKNISISQDISYVNFTAGSFYFSRAAQKKTETHCNIEN